MNEKLLHFIWQFKLFNQTELITAQGEKIQLINAGSYNTNAGADFQNAKIKIGNQLWAGNIEIHLQSKDWFTHRHEKDKNYNNVILHVVYESSLPAAVTQNGETIPTLELKSRINANTLYRYQVLEKNKTWIPCAAFFKEADEFTINNFLQRLLVERLEKKVGHIQLLLKNSENDWENVMFQMLARYFGADINKEPFELLAKSLPVKIWAKHQSDLLQIEALLFGQAGFLNDKFEDDYPNQLRKEYLYLKRLYNLEPLPKHIWKFLRLRPSNFPTLRLAQLAALMHKEIKLFANILEVKTIKQLQHFFDAQVSIYWKNHYQFDKLSQKVNCTFGKSAKNICLINAVVPVLFAYGKYKDDEILCERTADMLQSIDAEQNSIITGWKKLNLKPANAFETQALLQLKTEYCRKFRCLECAIGGKILR